MAHFKNPILRGFHPDPSICRVEEDYYMVTSTFEFFPGVPIYHSRNLIDWELINYCLVDDDQLDLTDCASSGGIYAPTLRYHDGVFYMITTNVTHKGNFIVHTKDIYGKWSKPFWVDQKDIDPSLFFDDDGKAYFTGNNSLTPQKQGIVVFEIDPMTGERLSEKKIVTYGTGGKTPEGSHMYKINGTYYLMLAEGGTEYGHMETIMRGDSPYGPFTECPHNPILSHKDYMGSQIQATGHADLVEDQNGNWWMVSLGIRKLPKVMLHNLGRETFLTPVMWKDGWPVAGDHGRTELEWEAPLPGEAPKGMKLSFTDHFDGDKLDLRWNFVRNPKRDHYVLQDGKLSLRAGEETLQDHHPTLLCVRQQEFEETAQTTVSCKRLEEGGKIGLTAYYNKDYHYEVYLTKRDGDCRIGYGWTVHAMEAEREIFLASVPEVLSFRVKADTRGYTFSYSTDGKSWTEAGFGAVAGLCKEGTMTMTFTGTYLGVFASRAEADVTSFSVEIDE